MNRSRMAITGGFGAGAIAGLYLASRVSYLLFHSLAELFAIVIAGCIFVIAWHSREILQNSYLRFLGPAYLSVGFLDLLHTLSYQGMGVFPAEGPNIATQLWIAARYLEAVSLAAAPLVAGRRARVEYILLVYGGVTALLAASILAWDLFPACFEPESGLTPFKKTSEYIICLLLAGAVVRLYHYRDRFDPAVFRLLTGSILLTILGELSFTAYVSVYGFFNLLGHFFKVASFYLIYKAFVETGFERPHRILYNDLTQSRERLSWEAHMNAALAELARSLIGQTDIEAVAGLVLHHGRQLTHSGWGVASYVDVETGRDIVAARSGDPPEAAVSGTEEGAGDAASGEGEGQILSAVSDIDGERVGRILLGGGRTGYRDRDRRLVERLADLYALAIQRYRREAEERQRLKADRNSLDRLHSGASPVSRKSLGQGGLQDTAPGQFRELIREHGEILERRMAARAYKTAPKGTDGIRDLADRLGGLQANPRDVIEIHMHSLEEKSRGVTHKKAMAYADEGRLMALELMGHLAAYYRLQC